MSLLAAVIRNRKVLKDNFPSSGRRANRTVAFLFRGKDQRPFADGLDRTFAWFSEVDQRLLDSCLNLPSWVRELRAAMRSLATEVTPIQEQELWGTFLATRWLDDFNVWEEPGYPRGTDLQNVPEDVLRDYDGWTILLTLCAYDATWLDELDALARQQPAAPPTIHFSDEGVSIRGGAPISVNDQQRTLLRVVYDAGERIPTKQIKKSAKEEYDCEMPVRINRLLDSLPEELRSLIDSNNAGYKFVRPTAEPDPK